MRREPACCWGSAPRCCPTCSVICLAAQVTATLQALGQFTVPALTPTVLNLCWLTGVWVIAPFWAPNHQVQAYVVAVSILIAGVLQLGVQLPALYRLGFRFQYHWAASRTAMAQISRTLTPMLFSLAVTQINTFTDSLIAWGLAAAPDGPQQIPWLGGAVRYPLEQGAAAAISYGERMYQFPLGIVGHGRGRLDLSVVEPARRPRPSATAWGPTSRWGCGWCCA